MIIGIDPGKNGGIVLLENSGYVASIGNFKLMTEMDVANWFNEELLQPYNALLPKDSVFAYLEKVHAIQPAGKVPNFKLGESFGMIKGILTALKIPFELVTPQKWQQAMGCMSKGDKNITKAKAQQLFPDIKITHNIADALLIAEYGRRTRTK